MICLVYKEQMLMSLLRNLLFLVLISSALGAIGLGAHRSKISQLPDGILSGNTYSNNALGLRYDVPQWMDCDPGSERSSKP